MKLPDNFEDMVRRADFRRALAFDRAWRAMNQWQLNLMKSLQDKEKAHDETPLRTH